LRHDGRRRGEAHVGLAAAADERPVADGAAVRRLVDAMRMLVTATNRLQHIEDQDRRDLGLLERVSAEQRAAAAALQEALLERGWRRPGQ